MEEILKQILDKVNGIQNEVKMINNRIDNLEYNIRELKTDVKEIKTDITELKLDNKQIKQAVLETNETVKRIETKQDEHQKVITELTYKTTLHDSELKRIK